MRRTSTAVASALLVARHAAGSWRGTSQRGRMLPDDSDEALRDDPDLARADVIFAVGSRSWDGAVAQPPRRQELGQGLGMHLRIPGVMLVLGDDVMGCQRHQHSQDQRVLSHFLIKHGWLTLEQTKLRGKISK